MRVLSATLRWSTTRPSLATSIIFSLARTIAGVIREKFNALVWNVLLRVDKIGSMFLNRHKLPMKSMFFIFFKIPMALAPFLSSPKVCNVLISPTYSSHAASTPTHRINKNVCFNHFQFQFKKIFLGPNTWMMIPDQLRDIYSTPNDLDVWINLSKPYSKLSYNICCFDNFFRTFNYLFTDFMIFRQTFQIFRNVLYQQYHVVIICIDPRIPNCRSGGQKIIKTYQIGGDIIMWIFSKYLSIGGVKIMIIVTVPQQLGRGEYGVNKFAHKWHLIEIHK